MREQRADAVGHVSPARDYVVRRCGEVRWGRERWLEDAWEVEAGEVLGRFGKKFRHLSIDSCQLVKHVEG